MQHQYLTHFSHRHVGATLVVALRNLTAFLAPLLTHLFLN